MQIIPRAVLAAALLLLFSSATLAASKADYTNYALNATNVLNGLWYNLSTGQWQDLWWNTANMITTLANLADLNKANYLLAADFFFQTSLVTAPAANYTGFINDYYDDEGWWAMAWIRVYDLTQNSTYLNTAEDIFADMQSGEDATCGGHWWSKYNDANTAIGNELYLSVAASLANRVPDRRSFYQDVATREYNWFIGSGMLNTNNTFNDGIDITTCEPEGYVWTYNQGVILGALIEMNRLTENQTYLDTASTIAHGAIEHLVNSNGILTESGYPDNLDPTSAQFKGVFVRNLGYLQSAAPDDTYVAFLQKNAHAIWSQGRQPDGQIGPHWQGPYYAADAASQSSALDCLVAAAAVSE